MKKNIILVAVIPLSLLIIIGGKSLIDSNILKTSVLESNTSTVTPMANVETKQQGVVAKSLNVVDGKREKYTFSADPKQIIETKLELFNPNENIEIIADPYVTGANPDAMGSSNSPLPRENPGEDAKWVKLPKLIKLLAGEKKIIPLTITIPEHVRPGDHQLNILVETIFPEEKKVEKQSGGGGEAAIVLRSKIPLFIKVSGEEISNLKIGDLIVSGKNPYIFNISISNEGNIIEEPALQIAIKSKFGTVADNEKPKTSTYKIQPGGKAKLSTQWTYDKMGIYDLDFTVQHKGKREIRTIRIIVYPTTKQIAIAIGILIILLGLIIFFIKRRMSHQANMPQPSIIQTPPNPVQQPTSNENQLPPQ